MTSIVRVAHGGSPQPACSQLSAPALPALGGALAGGLREPPAQRASGLAQLFWPPPDGAALAVALTEPLAQRASGLAQLVCGTPPCNSTRQLDLGRQTRATSGSNPLESEGICACSGDPIRVGRGCRKNP